MSGLRGHQNLQKPPKSIILPTSKISLGSRLPIVRLCDPCSDYLSRDLAAEDRIGARPAFFVNAWNDSLDHRDQLDIVEPDVLTAILKASHCEAVSRGQVHPEGDGGAHNGLRIGPTAAGVWQLS